MTALPRTILVYPPKKLISLEIDPRHSASMTPTLDTIRMIYQHGTMVSAKKKTKAQRVTSMRTTKELMALTTGNPDRTFLNEHEVAALSTLSVHTLRADRSRHGAHKIPFLKQGRRVVYKLADLLHHLNGELQLPYEPLKGIPKRGMIERAQV